jgi:hypothetical protein
VSSEKRKNVVGAFGAQVSIFVDSQTERGVLRCLEELRDDVTFDEAYMERLRSGDKETARHFDRHFRPLLRLKLWGRVNWKREEQLIDEVMKEAIEGIRREELSGPMRLPAYVCAICTRLLKQETFWRVSKGREHRITREQLRKFLLSRGRNAAAMKGTE